MKPSIATLAAYVLFLAIVPTARAADSQVAQEKQIADRVQEFATTWATHDGKGVAAFFTEAGDMISPDGRLARGRPQIEKFFDELFSGIGKNTTNSFSVAHVDILKPDVAIVNCDATLAGMRSPDGAELPPRKQHVTLVMVQQDGKWMFAAARPVAYQQHPGSSSGGAGAEEPAGKALDGASARLARRSSFNFFIAKGANDAFTRVRLYLILVAQRADSGRWT